MPIPSPIPTSTRRRKGLVDQSADFTIADCEGTLGCESRPPGEWSKRRCAEITSGVGGARLMNAPVLTQQQPVSVLPSEFEALCPPPQLLPGENIDQYHALQAAIFLDLDPQSAIEWLI